jgi:hypothetical protein
MAYGALIGAGAAALTYTLSGLMTGNWTWKGFGQAVL